MIPGVKGLLPAEMKHLVMSEAWHMNFCRRVRLSISMFTKKSCKVCFAQEVKKARWESSTWLLYDDNAPAPTALSIWKFLADKNIKVLEQRPYSPDLASCDFFLFPKVENIIKGTHFSSTDAIKNAVTKEL